MAYWRSHWDDDKEYRNIKKLKVKQLKWNVDKEYKNIKKLKVKQLKWNDDKEYKNIKKLKVKQLKWNVLGDIFETLTWKAALAGWWLVKNLP